MLKILAIIGLCGGLLCAIADLFLDLKGADNKKIGPMSICDSKWAVMPHWRFLTSTILAMFAVPMYSCGLIALMNILAKTHQTAAVTVTIIGLCGAMGGFMIHTFLNQMPTIYQTMVKKNQEELAFEVIEKVFKQIYVPFFTLYTCLVIIPAIVIMVFIIIGWLPLPIWCILLNPVVFQLIGILLRATKLKIFIDAPSCCAASLGLAMYGVLALMLL